MERGGRWGLRSIVAVSFMHRLKTKTNTKESTLMNRMLSEAPYLCLRGHMGVTNTHHFFHVHWWLISCISDKYNKGMSLSRSSRFLQDMRRGAGFYIGSRRGQDHPRFKSCSAALRGKICSVPCISSLFPWGFNSEFKPTFLLFSLVWSSHDNALILSSGLYKLQHSFHVLVS